MAELAGWRTCRRTTKSLPTTMSPVLVWVPEYEGWWSAYLDREFLVPRGGSPLTVQFLTGSRGRWVQSQSNSSSVTSLRTSSSHETQRAAFYRV